MQMYTMTSNWHFWTIKSRRLRKGSLYSRGVKLWGMSLMQERKWAPYYSQTFCRGTFLTITHNQRGELLACSLTQLNSSSCKSSLQASKRDAKHKDKPEEKAKCQALLGSRALSSPKTRDPAWCQMLMKLACSERRVDLIARCPMIFSACREARVGVRSRQ